MNAVSLPLWPCPNHCELWCRNDIRIKGDNLVPMTNHHPNCEHVNASLIDVWKASDGPLSFYTIDEAAAEAEADGCDDITISRVKMHREIYENLPEFDGF